MKKVRNNTSTKTRRGTGLTVMFCMMLAFPLIGAAAQPPDTYNVVTEGSAVGDGVVDNTVAINAAIAAARALGKDVYFPAGDYLISGNIVSFDGVSLYGDKEGLSLIGAFGSYQTLGDMTWGNKINNINIEDLCFLNVRIHYSGAYKRNYVIRRCIFVGNDPAFHENMQISWSNIKHGLIEHCIFLRQSNCQGPSLSTYRTRDCEIRENIWGLDLDLLQWLETEWSAYSQWDDLIGRLQTLHFICTLDRDQGFFKTAHTPNRVFNEKIYDNIYNGSPQYDSTIVGRDHIVYAKDYTNLEIVGNWMRGWPMSPRGALKLRNSRGPGIIAANHFVNTPILQYTYAGTTVPEAYENMMIYKNYFTITPDADEEFNRRGISYWEDAEIGGDANIEYHANLFNCRKKAPNVAIDISDRGSLAQHVVYDSNFYEATSTLIPYSSKRFVTSYTAGEPSADLSAYAMHPIPQLTIPEFGATVAIDEDFGGETMSSLTAKGWSFSGQSGVESVSLTSKSDHLGAGKRFLRIGGSSAHQPYGQVSFGEIEKGKMSLKAFTSSSYSTARIKLLDSSGKDLFTFKLVSPTKLTVENTTTRFRAFPMLNGASHDLLSARGNSITELMIKWDGRTCFWQARNIDADTGRAIMNTGFVKTRFGRAGTPSQIRIETGRYDNNARILGVTDIRVFENE